MRFLAYRTVIIKWVLSNILLKISYNAYKQKFKLFMSKTDLSEVTLEMIDEAVKSGKTQALVECLNSNFGMLNRKINVFQTRQIRMNEQLDYLVELLKPKKD